MQFYSTIRSNHIQTNTSPKPEKMNDSINNNDNVNDNINFQQTNSNNKENQEILKNKVNKLSNYIKKLSKVKEDASLINSLWIDLGAAKNVSNPLTQYYNMPDTLKPLSPNPFLEITHLPHSFIYYLNSIPHHKYKASKYNILRNIQPFQISHFSLSTILNSIYFRFLMECI